MEACQDPFPNQMRLLSCQCVHILHVCPKVRYICHMRPRLLCVLAYLQQAETHTPHSPRHPLVNTLPTTTIKNSTKTDQQSGPPWTISERVLLTQATSHAHQEMHMLSQRHERRIFHNYPADRRATCMRPVPMNVCHACPECAPPWLRPSPAAVLYLDA